MSIRKLILLGLNLPVMALAAEQRPNVLFIMSDDHATDAVSAYGGLFSGVFKTPNIDRIAREGALLRSCLVTNSICTPSRASILTGQYCNRTGVRTLSDPLDPSLPTFPKVFQQNGYQTAIFGKWHLHTDPHGFDTYAVLPGQGRYFNPDFLTNPAAGEKKPGLKSSKHVTEAITDMCIDWLNQRDKNKPFLLLCHNKAPHDPFSGFNPKYKEELAHVNLPFPPSWREDLSHRSEGSRLYGNGYRYPHEMVGAKWQPAAFEARKEGRELPPEQAANHYQTDVKGYLRLVRGIDDNLGRLLDYLEANHLLENTIIVYTSDQGSLLGAHDLTDKRWIWEGSIRMPFLIRYPARIKPGKVVDDLIGNIDIGPTLLELAGLPPMPPTDGRSFAANLVDKTPADWRTGLYYRYWMHMAHLGVPAHYGIRTKDYKLVFFYGLPLDATGTPPSAPKTPAAWELYDLRKDPEEMKNVYNDPTYSGVVKGLKAQLAQLKKQCGDTDEKYPELLQLLEKTP